MMTNILAILLGAITILLLAVFRVTQKKRTAAFREELIERYRETDRQEEES